MGALACLEGPNVYVPVSEVTPCDVKMLFHLIWYHHEQMFKLGAQRIEQELEGVNRTNIVSLRIPARQMAHSHWATEERLIDHS